MSLTITGTNRIREFARRLKTAFSSERLTAEAVKIAAEAGVILKDAVVQQCVDDIYELSGGYSPFTPIALPHLAEREGGLYGGLTEERTEALKRAHEVVDEGLRQVVRIDPEAEAEPDGHPGRERVIDYAIPVHEGYTQWVMGHDTGVHHIGRPWMWTALARHGDEVVGFVAHAFARVAEREFSRL